MSIFYLVPVPYRTDTDRTKSVPVQVFTFRISGFSIRLEGMEEGSPPRMGRHVHRHVSGCEDGPKGDGPRGWGMNPFIYMYVCICVCEGVRPGLGGCGRTKRTPHHRRRSKGVARLGRWQGDGPEDEPHTFQSMSLSRFMYFCTAANVPL
ncbi:hypothetical protein Hanom_Chr07g00620141 [Helianthus anomalus]